MIKMYVNKVYLNKYISFFNLLIYKMYILWKLNVYDLSGFIKIFIDIYYRFFLKLGLKVYNN